MAASAGKFVGRLRELETLRGTLEQVLARHGRVVLLAGEPGIGKTRMAQELALVAERCGATVLWGHCPEEAGAPPYWPWVQVIRAALRAADPRALLREVGSGASDICDIVPEIRDLLPELEPSVRLEDAAQARFRMFESIRQLLNSLGERQTTMLVLDDLHWADAPSLRLLEFLAPEIADARLLLVGTYRPTELSRQHPLSDALGSLARASHCGARAPRGPDRRGGPRLHSRRDRNTAARVAGSIAVPPDRGQSLVSARDRSLPGAAGIVWRRLRERAGFAPAGDPHS